MNHISIREGTTSDAASISNFQRNMALETESKILDENTVLKGVEKVLTSSDRGFYVIAEVDSKVIGSLMVTFEWSDWRNGWFFWIQSVFVDEAYRRQGVYRLMHNEVISRCKASKDCCGIRLYVERDNVNAQIENSTVGCFRTPTSLSVQAA